MTQNLMEFKGIVHTCFKDKINAGEFENKEQLPQAFLFFLCFSLRLLTCREPCQYKRNKGYTGETEEQATKKFWKHENEKYCKIPHAESNLERRGEFLGCLQYSKA